MKARISAIAALVMAVILVPLVTAPRAQAVTDPTIGVHWGTDDDSQIQKALGLDSGLELASNYSWLAAGIAHRSAAGWADPAAIHYLDSTMALPQPFGLNYAWDAFQDGTTNPASTIYTITIYQVGEVLLDAYLHGAATLGQITNAMQLGLNTPRFTTGCTGCIAVSYSNNVANDLKTGYAVHNINQALAMFLKDAQAAGITYQSAAVTTLINGLVKYEKANYQPAIFGWAYRNGGSQALQDPDHNSLGVPWGIRWYTNTIGHPMADHIEATNFTPALSGANSHAFVAQWTCPASATWFPEYDNYMNDPSRQTFSATSLPARPLAQSAWVCSGGTSGTARRSLARSGTFKVQPVKPYLRKYEVHVAPDTLW